MVLIARSRWVRHNNDAHESDPTRVKEHRVKSTCQKLPVLKSQVLKTKYRKKKFHRANRETVHSRTFTMYGMMYSPDSHHHPHHPHHHPAHHLNSSSSSQPGSGGHGSGNPQPNCFPHPHSVAAAAAAQIAATKMMINSAIPTSSKPLGSPSSGGMGSNVMGGSGQNCFNGAGGGLSGSGGGGGLGSGRYSPTYRVPDQMRDPMSMRRCIGNPTVSRSNECWDILRFAAQSTDESFPVTRVRYRLSSTIKFWHFYFADITLIFQRVGGIQGIISKIHEESSRKIREESYRNSKTDQWRVISKFVSLRLIGNWVFCRESENLLLMKDSDPPVILCCSPSSACFWAKKKV